MDRVREFFSNIPRLEETALIAVLFLTLAGILVTSLKFYFDLRGLIEDLSNKFVRKKPFQLRRTIVKTIAKAKQTQTIKLHTLRVFKDLDHLEIDPSPEITDTDDKRFVNISDRYAIPGRITETQDRKLRIDFEPDESPRARRDFTIVSSHIWKETMQDAWGEPLITVSQPMGKERLVVEFFCPRGWCYLKDTNNKPVVQVFTLKVAGSEKKEDREYVPATGWFADGANFAFNQSEGEIDWFRVTVEKPPKSKDITIEWFWDDKTKKLYEKLEREAVGKGTKSD